MAKSTKIIAALGVVAGLGVAALPLASYADDVVITDTITVNVLSSCEFSTGGSNKPVTANNVVAGTVADFGENATHAFTIKCNNNSYTVTAQASDLDYQGAVAAHGVITYSTNAAYAAGLDGSNKAKGDDGLWTAVLTGGDTDKAISKTAGTIKTGHATTDDTFSVEYKAFAGNAQTGGAYQGTVTYTLAAN